MKQNNDWEKRAEETLNCLDGIQRAEANPFLFTRIMARLEKKQSPWVNVVNFISRPVIAITVTALFICVNALVAIQHAPVSETAISSAEGDPLFDAEYATVNYSLMEANLNEK